MKAFKFLFIIAILTSIGIHSFAQNNPGLPAYPKKINVSGSAEMEIIPDELFFTVTLREYINKDKKKIEIESLEKELQAAVSAAGIPKENLQFESVFGERWKEKKGKPEDFMQTKSYIIKLSEPSKIDIILDKVDSKAILNVYLRNYSHSKIEQYTKELKILAIKNAKEKARYLLEAIGEKMGGTLSVSEDQPGIFYMNQNEISNNEYRQLEYNQESGYESQIAFKRIKLRFEIHTEFEIK